MTGITKPELALVGHGAAGTIGHVVTAATAKNQACAVLATGHGEIFMR